MKKRMFGTLLAFCLSVVLFGFVFCGTAKACPNPDEKCDNNTYYFWYVNESVHHLICDNCGYELNEGHYTTTAKPCGKVICGLCWGFFTQEHVIVTDEAVAPTCTTTGLTEGSHCARPGCRQVFVPQETVIALGHDTVTDEAVEATCTTDGLTEGSHCKRCDAVLVAQKVVPASHQTVTDEAVAATCTETGLTEGSHCGRCNEVLTPQETVEALGHDTVTDEAVAATCTETGLTEGSHCGRPGCGAVLVPQKTVRALGHDAVVDAPVTPSCTKTGLTEGTHCRRCGQILVAQEIVPKTEHNYDKGVVTKPTCSSEGYTTYTCKDCGYKLVTDKVKPLSHWYDLWEPTGDGRNSAPCKRSGCTYTKTTACVDWDFMLVPAGSKEAEGFTICPVCGAMSDGGRLELVESAVATPVVYWTPEGDLLVRWGTMENGETIMCVGFEFDARLAQCYGSIDFTVPAELLEGYRLMLLDAEGNETEMEVEIVGQKATFLVNFNADAQSRRTPVRMFHLVPLESEGTVEATEAEETAGK